MIQGIGGGYANLTPRPHMAVLSVEQKDQVANLLSDYDADSLSNKDARELVDQFKELGITPGRDLAMTLADNGFDARTMAAQAGLGVPNPSRDARDETRSAPNGYGDPAVISGPNSINAARNSVDERVLTLISEVMDSLNEAEDDSATFAERLAARLEEEGYNSTGPLMDFYA